MKKQNRLLSLILSSVPSAVYLSSAISTDGKSWRQQWDGSSFYWRWTGKCHLSTVRRTKSFVRRRGSEPCWSDHLLLTGTRWWKTLTIWFASHYDEDHIGGLVPCIDNFSVSNIFGPDYVHTSNLFNNFMTTATANAIIVQYPSVGEIIWFWLPECFTCSCTEWYQPEQ